MSTTPSDPHGPDAPVTPPACPRHPGRVAYVRCEVCARPACLECQRPRDDGSLACVDCLAAVASAPVPRPEVPVITASGTPVAPAPGRRHPTTPVTWVLLTLSVLVYGGQWLTRSEPTGVTASLWYAGVYTSELAAAPWRMLTYAFVHDPSGPTHLALNMLALWVIGRALEPVLGWWRTLALYLVTAVGGAVFALWTADPLQPVVGASGAVYGLFAALFLVTRSRGGRVGSIAALILVNLGASFLLPGVSWQVHVGGLLTGAAVGALYTLTGRLPHDAGRAGDRRSAAAAAGLHVSGLVLVLAGLAVLTLLGAARLPVAGLLD